MMNRQNYEAWFLDFLEGNLSEKQILVLTQFLAKNLDLKEELDEMELFVLPIDTNVVFPEKDLLKKSPAKQLSIDHLDNLLIGQLENTLSSKEENELKQALQSNPKIQKDQKLYQLTILKSDLSIIHPDKEQLKRKDRKIIPLRYFLQAAAMILLLVGAFLTITRDKTPNTIVHNKPKVESPTTVNKKIESTPENQLVEQPTIVKPSKKTPKIDKNRQEKIIPKAPSIASTKPTQKEKTILVSTIEQKPNIINPAPPKELAQQTSTPDTLLNKHPKNESITPINKGTLAKTESPKINTNKAPSVQSKSLALTAIDYGLTKVSKEKQNHYSIGNALTSSAEILTNNKVKIKKEKTNKRKRFSISAGRFGFSRSKSRG